jgi:hypothetical protein
MAEVNAAAAAAAASQFNAPKGNSEQQVLHKAVQEFNGAHSDVVMCADSLVARATRKPFGPEHERDIALIGKALSKTAVAVLMAVRTAASKIGPSGEPTMAAVKATSKCILDLVNAAKALTNNGNDIALTAKLHQTQRELHNLLESVAREAFAINAQLLNAE